MADTNFADILDRAPSEIEKPKPLPVGTYSTVLQGQPRQDKSSKKQTPFVEFQHKFMAPGDDVDSDALKDALTMADGTVKKLQDITMRNTFYLTENSAWRLKDFLQDCGFDIDDDEQSLREMIESSAGRQVNVYVKHTPSQDGKSTFAEIGSTAAAE
jgi:hypothetical protein